MRDVYSWNPEIFPDRGGTPPESDSIFSHYIKSNYNCGYFCAQRRKGGKKCFNDQTVKMKYSSAAERKNK